VGFDLQSQPDFNDSEPVVGLNEAGEPMEITDVRVFPVDEDKLKAYVTITLDNCFVIRDLKVIHGNGGLFIAMPAKRRKDGTYKDIAHPLNAGTRDWMEKAILHEYERQTKHPPPPMRRSAGAELVAMSYDDEP
jgi:stage V sporulation protein G